jgi:hypothetical protein
MIKNTINIEEFKQMAGVDEIFPLRGLLIDGAVIDISNEASPDPEKNPNIFYKVHSDLFVYQQADYLAGDMGWTGMDDIIKHSKKIITENNLDATTVLPVIFLPTEYGNLMYAVEKMNDIDFIQLDGLPQINTADEFFSTDKVGYVHVVEVGLEKDIPKIILLTIKSMSNKVIYHNGMVYIVYFLKGSPENMYDNFGNGIESDFTYFQGKFDLTKAIEDKSIFNISDACEKMNLPIIEILDDNEYIIDNFIINKTHQKFVINNL